MLWVFGAPPASFDDGVAVRVELRLLAGPAVEVKGNEAPFGAALVHAEACSGGSCCCALSALGRGGVWGRGWQRVWEEGAAWQVHACDASLCGHGLNHEDLQDGRVTAELLQGVVLGGLQAA